MYDQRKHWHLPCCSLVWRLKCQPGLNTWNWLQSVTKQNRLNYKTEKKQGSNLNYQTVLATLLTLGVNWKSIPCCCYTCYSLQNPSQQNPAILFLSRYDAHLCRHSHYVVLFASCLVKLDNYFQVKYYFASIRLSVCWRGWAPGNTYYLPATQPGCMPRRGVGERYSAAVVRTCTAGFFQLSRPSNSSCHPPTIQTQTCYEHHWWCRRRHISSQSLLSSSLWSRLTKKWAIYPN